MKLERWNTIFNVKLNKWCSGFEVALYLDDWKRPVNRRMTQFPMVNRYNTASDNLTQIMFMAIENFIYLIGFFKRQSM